MRNRLDGRIEEAERVERREGAKVTRILATISMVIITIAALLAIGYVIKIATTSPVLVVNKLPLPVITEELRPGGTMELILDYCKSEPIPSDITVEFQSEIIYPALAGLKEFPVGCNVVKPKVAIPIGLEPGDYELILKINYDRPGSFNDERYFLTSERFTVHAPAKLPGGFSE